MSQKENIAATWDDMDWGQLDPSRMVAKSAPAHVEAKFPMVENQSSPPVVATPPGVDLLAEQARLQAEIERVKMEAELARVKAELLEQQRVLAAPQPKVVEIPRTIPLNQDPSVVFPTPAAGAAVVFNPKTLATLTLVSEGGHETLVTVTDDFTVGRNKTNGLAIRDLHVSAQHAKFSRSKDGLFEITDLDSSGGTFVNGQRIARCALKSGDKIEFATVAAIFRYVAGELLDPEDEIEGTLVQSKAAAARKLAAVSQAPSHGMISVLKVDEQSRDIPIGGQITIGRAAGNDLVITEEHVSGRHARLAGNGRDGFELFDLGSSCGTFVNGIQISHWVLQSGDRIRFGLVDCVFMIVDPRGAIAVKEPARVASSLPQVEDSGLAPLPEPRPAVRAGQQIPLIR